MMIGIVRDRRVLLPVPLQFDGMPEVAIEFIVDTGFTGLLSLPPDAIAAMRLPFPHIIPAQLADGSFVDVAVHNATISWMGKKVEARVLATSERPLMGTALLDRTDLRVQFREGGLV